MSEERVQDRRERTKPESLRLRALTPGLTVADLQTSLRWYRDILGFTVEETWEHDGRLTGVALIAGTERLMLWQDDWAKGRDRKKGEGFRLYLSTVQDVDQLARGIEQRGGRLESRPHDSPSGSRAFSLVDPDGFRITIWSGE